LLKNSRDTREKNPVMSFLLEYNTVVRRGKRKEKRGKGRKKEDLLLHVDLDTDP